MNFQSKPLVPKTYEPEAFPPRRLGWQAALNLNRGIEDNPYGVAPIDQGEAGQLHDSQPNHPHREWREGFIRSRILLQKQNAANFAIGKGLILQYRLAPSETIKLLCQMGRQSGEFIALALLVAAMDIYGVEADGEDPIATGIIYGAMKDRLGRRACAPCHDPEYQQLSEAAYTIGEFLETVFKRQPSAISVTCQIGSLKFALDRLLDMDNEDNTEICTGETSPDGEPIGTHAIVAPYNPNHT